MSDATTAREYVFECRACGQSFEVDPGMRDALVDSGCPVCCAAVSDDSFTPIPTQ